MCNGSECDRLRRQSFIYGQLALTGSWVLFVLALLLASLVPESVIKSTSIVMFYSLFCTVLWGFYIVTHLGCSFMLRFPEKKAVQWGGLLAVCVLLGVSAYYCALVIPLILTAVPIALLTKRCWKCVGLNVVAGCGEFLAVGNTVLLALLIKALLLADWELAGIGLRCDVLLCLSGIGGVLGVLARGRLLGGNDWKVRDLLKSRLVMIMWSVVVLTVIGSVIANQMQTRKLDALKNEAEKLFGRELSATGLQLYYLDGQPVQAEYYAGLDALTRQLSGKLRSPELRKLFRMSKDGQDVREALAQTMKKLQAGAAAEYALLDKCLSVDALPKAHLNVADGQLAGLRQEHLAILRRCAGTVLGRMRSEPENIVKYSEQFFKLLKAMERSTAAGLAGRAKLCERWLNTVEKLAHSGKVTAGQRKALKALAQSYVDKIDVEASVRDLCYLEAVFAYDLYRANSLTSVNATGAYFRYDRAEALRSLLDAARKNGRDYQKPARGIARITMMPLEVFVSSLNDIKKLPQSL